MPRPGHGYQTIVGSWERQKGWALFLEFIWTYMEYNSKLKCLYVCLWICERVRVTFAHLSYSYLCLRKSNCALQLSELHGVNKTKEGWGFQSFQQDLQHITWDHPSCKCVHHNRCKTTAIIPQARRTVESTPVQFLIVRHTWRLVMLTTKSGSESPESVMSEEEDNISCS